MQTTDLSDLGSEIQKWFHRFWMILDWVLQYNCVYQCKDQPRRTKSSNWTRNDCQELTIPKHTISFLSIYHWNSLDRFAIDETQQAAFSYRFIGLETSATALRDTTATVPVQFTYCNVHRHFRVHSSAILMETMQGPVQACRSRVGGLVESRWNLPATKLQVAPSHT